MFRKPTGCTTSTIWAPGGLKSDVVSVAGGSLACSGAAGRRLGSASVETFACVAWPLCTAAVQFSSIDTSGGGRGGARMCRPDIGGVPPLPSANCALRSTPPAAAFAPLLSFVSPSIALGMSGRGQNISCTKLFRDYLY